MFRPLVLLAAVPLVAAAAAVPARAQRPAPVAIGATVRVLAPPGDSVREGRLVALDAERLVVLVPFYGYGGDIADTIPVSAVRRLEMRHGPSRARQAFAYGALGGLALGAVAGVTGYYATRGEGSLSGIGAVLAWPGFVVGGIVGAVIGANSGGKWVQVPLPGGDVP